MNLVFFTPHILPGISRKSSFLLLAEKAAEHGDNSAIITVGYSYLSLVFDGMRGSAKRNTPLNRWLSMAPRLETYVWRSLFHPANLRKPWLNALTKPLRWAYPYLLPRNVVGRIKKADVLVIESSTALFLLPRLHKLAPTAKLVYVASDRLPVIQAHPALQTLLDAWEPRFHLIRVHAEAQLADFKNARKVVLLPQAITTNLLDAPAPSPYSTSPNAISVGDMLFDPWAIATLAKAFPHWTFHLFGARARLAEPLANVVEHGETPLNILIPFIQHADVGLAPYRPKENTEYLAQSSMKMAQYTYCKLPIVAPTFAQSTARPHVCGYTPQDETSLVQAFQTAATYNRKSITHSLKSWDETWDMLKAEIESAT